MAKNKNMNKGRVVNIVGRAPSAFNKPVIGENWGINHAWSYDIPIDVWFAIDGWERMIQAVNNENIIESDFLEYAKSFKGPIYTFSAEKMLDTKGDVIVESEGLPLQKLRGLSGTYFTSSVAWMLAMVALQEELGYQKVDLVNLYGIELWISHDANEYTAQADCINYWIAFLNGRGTQVVLPAYLLSATKHEDNMYGFRK